MVFFLKASIKVMLHHVRFQSYLPLFRIYENSSLLEEIVGLQDIHEILFVQHYALIAVP